MLPFPKKEMDLFQRLLIRLEEFSFHTTTTTTQCGRRRRIIVVVDVVAVQTQTLRDLDTGG